MFTESFQCIHCLGFSVVDVRDVAFADIWQWKRTRLPRVDFCVEFCMVSLVLSRRTVPGPRTPSMNMPNWLVHLFGLFNGGVRQLRDDLNRTA